MSIASSLSQRGWEQDQQGKPGICKASQKWRRLSRNAFEAEVLSGVEDAPDADEREVATHEVPEDDVPPEYRERD